MSLLGRELWNVFNEYVIQFQVDATFVWFKEIQCFTVRHGVSEESGRVSVLGNKHANGIIIASRFASDLYLVEEKACTCSLEEIKPCWSMASLLYDRVNEEISAIESATIPCNDYTTNFNEFRWIWTPSLEPSHPFSSLDNSLSNGVRRAFRYMAATSSM